MKKKMKRSRSHDECLRQDMLAAGCPLPGADPSAPRDLVIVPDLRGKSVARVVKCHTEYILRVRIRNLSYAPLRILKIIARPPWRNAFVCLRSQEGNSNFRMPSGQRFRSDEVLNRFIGDDHGIEPGEQDGYLLGLDLSHRIPQEYVCESTVPVEFCITDQFRRVHKSEIEVSIDRLSLLKRPLRFDRVSSSLFEPLDRVPALRINRSEKDENWKEEADSSFADEQTAGDIEVPQ